MKGKKHFNVLDKMKENRNKVGSRVKLSKGLEKLLAISEKFLDLDIFHDELSYKDIIFDNFSEFLGYVDYDEKDSETYASMISLFSYHDNYKERAGLMVSATVNEIGSLNSDLTLEMDPMDRLDDILYGFEWGKATIIGDVGDGFCSGMRDGIVLLNGDAGDEVCYGLEGGKVTITGNAGHRLGRSMSEGIIKVHGNAGDEAGLMSWGGKLFIGGYAGDRLGMNNQFGDINVKGDVGVNTGHMMRGGKLRIDGDLTSLSPTIHYGDIVYKGNKIFSKHQNKIGFV